MHFAKPELINRIINLGIPKLLPRTIHVWSLTLEYSDNEISSFASCLSQEEKERSNRFIFKKGYREFIIARSSLRHILGSYSDTEPKDIEFITTKEGKPLLATFNMSTSAINFNLSHSNGRALITICLNEPVGVDLEFVRYDDDLLEISEQFFFGSENKYLINTPPKLKHQTFFRIWVAKEAVLKGEGLGLGFPLNQFEVRFNDSQTTANVTSYNENLLSKNWIVHSLPCGDSWKGAIATQWKNTNIEYIL